MFMLKFFKDNKLKQDLINSINYDLLTECLFL